MVLLRFIDSQFEITLCWSSGAVVVSPDFGFRVLIKGLLVDYRRVRDESRIDWFVTCEWLSKDILVRNVTLYKPTQFHETYLSGISKVQWGNLSVITCT